ncbi:DUF1415 domain-containing protein [Pseudidiomarina insulisalsae]|uniref:DUF1415 domain-containing protein n=1 Tax=Pseudidiomarina insulisalsae TaxID=575789 RepID=A0A432YPD2_9GAMM|nr:DUF1415 domain-containing protein [Pseudidiomarina insulisalsae]RUO62980.1 DUF1415 domain-containing protein [Pseudidiomarina insulisalsae]
MDDVSAPCRAVQQWVAEIVVGLNFCPFAHREVERRTVRYDESNATTVEPALHDFAQAVELLSVRPEIETLLLVFSAGFSDFDDYLELLDYAELLLQESGLEGTFQIASFHPDYQFADTAADDVSNYTNRAPYPVLHLLREASLEKVLTRYPQPEQIPAANMATAERLGAAFFDDILLRLRNTD